MPSGDQRTATWPPDPSYIAPYALPLSSTAFAFASVLGPASDVVAPADQRNPVECPPALTYWPATWPAGLSPPPIEYAAPDGLTSSAVQPASARAVPASWPPT